MKLLLQEYQPKEWGGLTTKNHLSAAFGNLTQKASTLTSMVFASNYNLIDFGAYLKSISTPIYLDSDDDFIWDLMNSEEKNVPLIEARIDNTAIVPTDKTGFNYSRFQLVFPEAYFFDVNIIEGHKHEYQIRILDDARPEGSYWVYDCELVTGDALLFIPYEELLPGTKFSKLYSGVESTLSKKGGKVRYSTPFKMKNLFTRLRMEDTVPGNMISRPMGFTIQVRDPRTNSIIKTNLWQQYRDWEFDRQYVQEKNYMLYYSRINRAPDGTFKNKGKSGYEYSQGAGLRQQIETSSTAFYPVKNFTIKGFLNVVLDLATNRLPFDKRQFLVRTGERGLIQASEQIAKYGEQFFEPIRSVNQFISMSSSGDAEFKGQFKSFRGPNGVVFDFMLDPIKDDPIINKIPHPDGGTAESYTYDILDIGTTNGERNISMVYQRGMEDIKGYEPGLRNPFVADYSMIQNNIMSNPIDGYVHHRFFMGGVKVTDPTKCLVYKCAI
ncbi:MAG TPA: hypothetical protein PK415_04360 [Bacilli bacterium]|nr:hypothetical protein [Bacilli bacterium]